MVDFIILTLIFAYCVWVIRNEIRKSKAAKASGGSCACGGSCTGCNGSCAPTYSEQFIADMVAKFNEREAGKSNE